MISKLIESFANELQKEETQEYISNVINPYLSKYKYYLFLISFMLFIIFSCTAYNTVILHRIINNQIVKMG